MMYLLVPNPPKQNKVQPHLKPHEFFLSVLDIPTYTRYHVPLRHRFSGVEWSVNLYNDNHPKNGGSSKGKAR